MRGHRADSLFVLTGLLLVMSLVLSSCTLPSVTPLRTAVTLAPEVSPAPCKVPTKALRHEIPYPVAVEAARQTLSTGPGVSLEVTVRDYAPIEWSDSCLGLPQSGEMCLQVNTPGYGGMLVAGDRQWEFRTDEAGETIRLIPGAALSARQVLMQQLQVTLSEIVFVEIEEVEWPDACLGIVIEDRVCSEALTPGYRVVLGALGEQYEFHTDWLGGTVLLAGAPAPIIDHVAVVWADLGDEREMAVIGRETLAFGALGGAMMTVPFAEPDRLQELTLFVETYASFDAHTPAGEISFSGEGSKQATAAEQRMIAEWARLVALEGAAGRGGASWGLVLAWHSEAATGDPCANLTVYLTGQAFATSCANDIPQELGRGWLSADQLEQVYGWVDALRVFELERATALDDVPAVTRIVFSGAGDTEPTESQALAIHHFAGGLYHSFLEP